MKKGLKEELNLVGVDYDTALERFMMKEDLYYGFMVKFLSDSNISKLKQSISEKNADEAFKAAHTLKGLAGNLGFDNLLEVITPLVEILRQGSLDGVEELFEKLQTKYDELCSIIKKYA